MVTSTPGIKPPLLSMALPVIAPVGACEKAGATTINNRMGNANKRTLPLKKPMGASLTVRLHLDRRNCPDHSGVLVGQSPWPAAQFCPWNLRGFYATFRRLNIENRLDRLAAKGC